MNLDPQKVYRLEDIETLVRKPSNLKLASKATQAVRKTHAKVSALAAESQPHYGINTGFGRLAQVKVPPAEQRSLQVNLLRSHASGIGAPVSERVVRRLTLLRILSLGKGRSGVSPALLQRHFDYWNKGLTPWVPELGSVGASGDLAPLAHYSLTLMGEGHFWMDNKKVPAKKVLQAKRLKPILIGPKEGLALVNGTQFSLALALEVREQLQPLLDWMLLSACLSIEGHRSTRSVFDPDLHALKAHPHQRIVAELFWRLLDRSPHMKGHRDCDLVQDAYSFRCIPQIWGPCLSFFERADELLEDELNSVSDNPLFVGKNLNLLSGGHFHAQTVSMASDLMAISMATLSQLIERRLDQIMSPLTSRTEAFLADRPGVESGMMILQTAAAALAAENKVLAHPASIETIPTNGNQEDHVSMAPLAARKALMSLKNLRRLIAAEVLVGVRACVLEARKTNLAYAPAVESFLKYLGKRLPQIFEPGDRIFGDDWQELEALMESEGSPLQD